MDVDVSKKPLTELCPDKLYSTEELAVYFGLFPRTLVNWRMGSKGPKFVKLGHYVRYKGEHVLEWMRRNTFSSTPKTV